MYLERQDLNSRINQQMVLGLFLAFILLAVGQELNLGSDVNKKVLVEAGKKTILFMSMHAHTLS